MTSDANDASEPIESTGSVDLAALTQFFDSSIPFNAFLGLKLIDVGRGYAVAELPFRAEFIGDPIRPALHGGVISMLADTVGGAAVYTMADPGDRVATIDLRVDYLRRGREEPLRGRADVIRAGNRVGVASVAVYHPSTPDAPVAVAKGVYTIRRGK